MLIDNAKGVEPEPSACSTCRLRKMPVMTFTNKMDRPVSIRSTSSTMCLGSSTSRPFR